MCKLAGWKTPSSQFCPWCACTKSEAHLSVRERTRARCKRFVLVFHQILLTLIDSSLGPRPDRYQRNNCSTPSQIAACLLHLELRITELLLRCHAEALYGSSSEDSQSKKLVSDFEARLQSTSKRIHVQCVGKARKGCTERRKRCEVTGLTGDAVERILSDTSKYILRPPVSEKKVSGKKVNDRPWLYSVNMWKLWAKIRPLLHDTYTQDDLRLDKLQQDIALFVRFFIRVNGVHRVTPYIHVLYCHIVDLLRRFGNLSKLSQQGVEHANKEAKRILRNNTSAQKSVPRSMQLLKQFLRRSLIHDSPSQDAADADAFLNYLNQFSPVPDVSAPMDINYYVPPVPDLPAPISDNNNIVRSSRKAEKPIEWDLTISDDGDLLPDD